MPALKRARPASLTNLASPTSPTPSARRLAPKANHALTLGLGLAQRPSLRQSLRHWREGSSSSESDTDVEFGTSLAALEEVDYADEDEYEDEDVDSVLVPGPCSPRPRDVKSKSKGRRVDGATDVKDKGKGVDPREYAGRSTPSVPPMPDSSTRSQAERVLQRRLPKGPTSLRSRRRGLARRIPSSFNIDPRRIVSPTESLFALTDGIDSLATDEQEEELVSHALMLDSDDNDADTPPPMSPSPAPPSDTETDDSPLASKSRRMASAKERRSRLAKKRAAHEHGNGMDKKQRKKKMLDGPRKLDPEEDRLEAVRALQSLASAAGFRLVPVSPGGEPMETEPRLEIIVHPPVRAIPYTPDTGFGPIVRQTTVPSLPTMLDALVDAPATPRKRKAAAEPTFTEPDTSKARQRYTSVVPKKDAPATSARRKQGGAAAASAPRSLPRSVGPETSHLHRRSPTSLIPSRDRLRVKPKTNKRVFARRPVVLHRPKRPSTFVSSWHDVDESLPVVPGAVYAAAMRDRAVHHHVRSNLLKRYRERVFPREPAISQPAAQPHRHQRSHSTASADDDEVEALLPLDDVEMLDSEAVDNALAVRRRSPSVSVPHRPLKRNAGWGAGEVASRRAIRTAEHVREMENYAKSVRFYLISRREKRAAVKEYAAGCVRAAVAAALAADHERRAEEAELARLAIEAQAELDAMNARIAAEAAAAAAAEAQAHAETWNARHRARPDRIGTIRRRRAADSVAAHMSNRPRTRLAADRHRVSSLNAEAGPSRAALERVDEPQDSVDPQERAHTNALGLLSPAELVQCLPRELPAPEAEPEVYVQVEVEIQQAPVADPVTPAPPQYEYPFFPIIRPAAPVHLRPAAAANRNPRRHTVGAMSPPAYAPNRYSRRSPSPPPPYNAQTDCATLAPPVFRERDQRCASEGQRESMQRNRNGQVRVLRAPVAVAQWDHPHRAPPADVVDVDVDVDVEMEVDVRVESEYEEDWSSDEDNTQDGRPIFGTIRRWLGFGW